MATNKELEKRLNETTEAVNNQIRDLQSGIDRIAEMLASAQAPAQKQLNSMDPQEHQIGQDQTAEFKQGTSEFETPELDTVVEPVTKKMSKDKLAMNAFMNEMVEIEVHDTSEPNAAPTFEISVNNRKAFFIRGRRKKVERFFVEGLARAKPVHFRNEEYTREDGVRAVRYPSHTGLRYPFHVVHDPNPRGERWLQNILRQP